jgi:ABC-type glycerol-3-phosphate transport system substrate-binding protein
MKKIRIVAAVVLLGVLFLAGCTQSTPAASEEAASQTAAASSDSASESGAQQTGEVPVDNDMATEEDSQASVDEGHSPWRLDPAQVAQSFVGGLMEPGGIVGDMPIPLEDFEVTQNAGGEAVVVVNNDESPAATVYLKQLVRQDDTGTWSVVGYDPRS